MSRKTFTPEQAVGGLWLIDGAEPAHPPILTKGFWMLTALGFRYPAIRKDGLEMFLDPDRPGTIGGNDFYVSTRASTAEPWSTPVNLGVLVNSSVLDARQCSRLTALNCTSTQAVPTAPARTTSTGVRGSGLWVRIETDRPFNIWQHLWELRGMDSEHGWHFRVQKTA